MEASNVLHFVELTVELNDYFAAPDQPTVIRENCILEGLWFRVEEVFDQNLLGHLNVDALAIRNVNLNMTSEVFFEIRLWRQIEFHLNQLWILKLNVHGHCWVLTHLVVKFNVVFRTVHHECLELLLLLGSLRVVHDQYFLIFTKLNCRDLCRIVHHWVLKNVERVS